MAKLVNMWHGFHPAALEEKQMPLIVEENLAMVMDIRDLNALNENSPLIKGPELQEFIKKLNLLSKEELKNAFEVSYKQMQTILDHSVPCIGCRRSVERVFYDLSNLNCHPALDPIIITPEAELTIKDDILENPQRLCTLLHNHSQRLNELVEQQTRNKKSHRCILHSLEMQRMRPPKDAWKDIWNCMEQECLKEITFIDAETLEVTLDTYLHKHKFCSECRTKVLLASSLLTTDADPTKEKGYKSDLYADIKRCTGGHVHLPLNDDYITKLINRAQPELMGRERHAKTLEIAQEEVLTCLGICVAERLNLIYRRLKEEEIIVKILAAVSIDALSRHFHLAVYIKEGITQLEIYFNEELVKLEKRLKLRLKRKEKKERRSEKKRKEIELEELNAAVANIEFETDIKAITCGNETSLEESNVKESKLEKCKSQESKVGTCKDQESKVGKCKDQESKVEKTVSTSKKQVEEQPEDKKSTESCTCPTDSQKNRKTLDKSQSKSQNPSQSISSPVNKKSGKKAKKKDITPVKCNVKNENKRDQNLSSKKEQNSNVKSSKRSSKESKKVLTMCSELDSSTSSCKFDETCVLSNESDFHMLPKAEYENDCDDKEMWIEVKKRLDNRPFNRNSRSSSEHSRDRGYSSEHTVGSSSLPCTPEGSEVACSDGCCNHEGDCPDIKHINNLTRSDSGVSLYGTGMSLLQMLENFQEEDNDFSIPQEEVLEFKSKIGEVTEQRKELRQTLQRRFDILCNKAPCHS